MLWLNVSTPVMGAPPVILNYAPVAMNSKQGNCFLYWCFCEPSAVPHIAHLMLSWMLSLELGHSPNGWPGQVLSMSLKNNNSLNIPYKWPEVEQKSPSTNFWRQWSRSKWNCLNHLNLDNFTRRNGSERSKGIKSTAVPLSFSQLGEQGRAKIRSEPWNKWINFHPWVSRSQT